MIDEQNVWYLIVCRRSAFKVCGVEETPPRPAPTLAINTACTLGLRKHIYMVTLREIVGYRGRNERVTNLN